MKHLGRTTRDRDVGHDVFERVIVVRNFSKNITETFTNSKPIITAFVVPFVGGKVLSPQVNLSSDRLTAQIKLPYNLNNANVYIVAE